MNTRKTIYNKLFSEKTELAKHEVELALVDDLNKLVAEMKSKIIPVYEFAFKEHKELNTRWNKLMAEVQKTNPIYIKNNTDFTSLFKQIKQQSETLGIDMSSIKGFNEAVQLYDNYSRIYKTFDPILKREI